LKPSSLVWMACKPPNLMGTRSAERLSIAAPEADDGAGAYVHEVEWALGVADFAN
jgi:hypothetical protein